MEILVLQPKAGGKPCKSARVDLLDLIRGVQQDASVANVTESHHIGHGAAREAHLEQLQKEFIVCNVTRLYLTIKINLKANIAL